VKTPKSTRGIEPISYRGMLVCSFSGAMAGSLFVASSAVSYATFAMVDSGLVRRSACGPRTLRCGRSTLIGESSVYLVSTFTEKFLLLRQDFRTRN
jgi:hypothetical protein